MSNMKTWLLSLALLTLAALPTQAGCTGATCFWVGGSGTWDNTNTGGGGTGGIKWATASGGTTGAGFPTTGSDNVVFDANSCASACTITVASTATTNITSINCAALANAAVLDFSANNNNVTLAGSAGFNCSGSGTRTLNMGNGTWTLSANTGAWNITTSTGMTLNAGNSTIMLSASACQNTINGGGLAYHTITFNCSGSSAAAASINNSGGTITTLNYTPTGVNPLNITGTAATITNLNITPGTSGSQMSFPNGVTTTVGTITTTSSSTNAIQLISNSSFVQATISAATNQTLTWAALNQMAFTGAGTWTCNNCINAFHATGITVNSGGGGGGIIGIIGG